MVEEGIAYGQRVWFHDVRTPVRRMAVTPHPRDGVIVISLWQGDSCTGTFRLRLDDAAPVIATLAEGMAEGLPIGSAPSGPQRSRQWNRINELVRKLTRRGDSPRAGQLQRIK
jgi:hypothetical protein